MTPIYPEIRYTETGHSLSVFTRVRKKHCGKYYFWDILQKYYISENSNIPKEKERLLDRIHHEAYFIIIFGKVNPKMLFNGDKENKVFPKDIDQRDEAIRLKEKYKLQ